VYYNRNVNELKPPSDVFTSLTWDVYHDLLREKYHYSHNLREWLFARPLFSISDSVDNLIDPTTIPLEEWQHFIDLAYQILEPYYSNKEGFSKEATVIDFTDDFVYVLFLFPKMEELRPGPDFHFWVKLNRKTGKLIFNLIGH
jgi:hypothetical protein